MEEQISETHQVKERAQDEGSAARELINAKQDASTSQANGHDLYDHYLDDLAKTEA